MKVEIPLYSNFRPRAYRENLWTKERSRRRKLAPRPRHAVRSKTSQQELVRPNYGRTEYFIARRNGGAAGFWYHRSGFASELSCPPSEASINILARPQSLSHELGFFVNVCGNKISLV